MYVFASVYVCEDKDLPAATASKRLSGILNERKKTKSRSMTRSVTFKSDVL